VSFARKTLNVVRIVFTPLSVLVIVGLIWSAREALADVLRQGRWELLLSAVLVWILGNLLSPLVTMFQFKTLGHDLSYAYLLRVHCRRLPAKYLPGGIWHSVGRAHDYVAAGHSPALLGFFFMLENFLLVAVTLGMSAWIVQPLVAIPLLSMLTGILSPLMGLALLVCPFVLRVVSRGRNVVALGPYWSSVLVLASYWVLLSVAFVFYLSAFDTLPIRGATFEFGAIYVFSWCLGYMALFAPQGIGVAEFISATLLAGSGVGAVAAFLIGFRLLALVADLLTWQGVRLLGASSAATHS
jgi:hypothetical protein